MKANQGFTLIELMIVVAIIAIIAAVAIPALLRSRISANEGAAAATLRSISTAETQFRGDQIIDQDSDGSGEYGTLSEMAATADIRTTPGAKVLPNYIPSVLGPRGASSTSTKSGYQFISFLPGPGGSPIDNLGTLAVPSLGSKDQSIIDAQEQNYRLYAWPDKYKITGSRVFGVDSRGELMVTNNAVQVYNGRVKQVQYNAAVDSTCTDASDAFEGALKKWGYS